MCDIPGAAPLPGWPKCRAGFAPRWRLPRSVRRLGTVLPLLACLGLALPVGASQIQYLKRNEQICDDTGRFCLRGTLSYRQNLRLLRISGRVLKAPGPGLLQISVVGANRLEHPRRAALEVRLRGRASEIVRHEMIPDAPDVYEWELAWVVYKPDQP